MVNLYSELEWNEIEKAHNFEAYKFSECSKNHNHRQLVWWILPSKNIFQRNALWIEATRHNLWKYLDWNIYTYHYEKIIKFVLGNYYELWGTLTPIEKVSSQLKISSSAKKHQLKLTTIANLERWNSILKTLQEILWKN